MGTRIKNRQLLNILVSENLAKIIGGINMKSAKINIWLIAILALVFILVGLIYFLKSQNKNLPVLGPFPSDSLDHYKKI